jgi:uncharacterized protein (DUF2237 family)
MSATKVQLGGEHVPCPSLSVFAKGEQYSCISRWSRSLDAGVAVDIIVSLMEQLPGAVAACCSCGVQRAFAGYCRTAQFHVCRFLLGLQLIQKYVPHVVQQYSNTLSTWQYNGVTCHG